MSTYNKKEPNLVRLFVAITYSQDSTSLTKVLNLLKKEFGEPTAISQVYDFSKISKYYDKELGTGLKKFLVMYSLINPDDIAKTKLLTNKIEDSLRKKNSGKSFKNKNNTGKKINAGNRTINLDPGYVSITNVVLASTKNFSHRIYLNRGIYGEITLIFRKNLVQELEWTYPDFRTGLLKDFLLKERTKLLNSSKNYHLRA